MTTPANPTSSGLVLGGGGITGIAWEIGLLAGLSAAGVDLLDAAVDTDGEFRLLRREDGVALRDAVAASCAVPAVYPPVPIDGRLYVDGGARTGANADVAVDCDRVIVLTHGRVVMQGTPDEVASDPRLAALYAGEPTE